MAQIEVARVLEDGTSGRPAVDRGLEVDAIDCARVAQIRKRPQHEPIDHAEHRGVGADAEPERQNDGDREPRRSTEPPECVPKVLMQRPGEPVTHLGRVAVLVDEIDSAEPQKVLMTTHDLAVRHDGCSIKAGPFGGLMSARSLTTAGVAVALTLGAAPLAAAQEHAHATESLGTVHFATSCRPAVAPQFDRAVALLHSFEFGAAIRGFETVLALDSTCAMADWGIALSRWSNPMAAGTRAPAQLQPGARCGREGGAARRHARASANACTRTRSAKLYDDYEHVDQRTRVVNYEHAMAALVAKQPADTEAKIFYAIALTASAPPTDKTYANQLKAGSMLESLWVKQPNHPGLAHYIIHTYDVPALAPRAKAAAERYARIAPSAAHALHMPSHTFTRVGQWDQSIETNSRSIDVARQESSIGEALHASDYLEYAYLQEGRDSAALATLRSVPALAAKFDVNAIAGAAPGSAGVFALAAIPARYALERRDWTRAASLELPAEANRFPWTAAMVYFGRGLGAAHTGDVTRAAASADSLSAIHDRLVKAGEPYWAEQVAIQELGVRAWIAVARKQGDSAVRLMSAAAQREDATEKSAVTPGPLAPARELLGDMQMELGRPADALVAYRSTLEREPNRFRSLDGAMRAAAASGDRATAERYRSLLRTLTAKADTPGRQIR